jgi:hypothetical protein
VQIGDSITGPLGRTLAGQNAPWVANAIQEAALTTAREQPKSG